MYVKCVTSIQSREANCSTKLTVTPSTEMHVASGLMVSFVSEVARVSFVFELHCTCRFG